MVSNSRGLVDLLVGDVGVKFPVEVVVFAVHLGTQVADSRIYIRIHLAEPCIHIGIQIAEALIHVGAKIVYTLIKTVYTLVKTVYSLVKTVYSLVKIADSIVHIAEALIHMGVKIDYPLVKIADSIVHIAESLVKIDESIVHITESLALYGYHVIKNSRESQNKTNKERYEFNVGHGGYSFRGYSGNCMTFARLMSRGKSRRKGRSGGDYGVQVTFILVGAVSNCACPVRLERDLYGSSIAVAILLAGDSLDHSLSVRLIAPTGVVTLLVGAIYDCAYPVRLERDLYGSSIAVAIHSLDHSLSVRLIAPTGS